MNNVQSGIIAETMNKERKAREKWTALYSSQFGLPLSHPGDDDHPNATLLPGPTIRIRNALPTQLAYVPSAYQVAKPEELKANGAAGANAKTHHAPYAYASANAAITKSGPLNPTTDLYVRGDNSVVNSNYDHKHAGASARGFGRAFNHGGMAAAGIKTRPPQQLLTHTKPEAGAAVLAPSKNKIGAAVAAQTGREQIKRPATPQKSSAQPQDLQYSEAEPESARAALNATAAAAASPRPPSAALAPASARNNASLSLSATQLSQYNPMLSASSTLTSSARVPPSSPSVVAQKSQALYLALGFRVQNTDQRGVLVTKVDKASAAELAGLRTNDLIAYVNSKPTRSVDEYHAVVAHAHGTLHLIIRRRGVAKLAITLKV